MNDQATITETPVVENTTAVETPVAAPVTETAAVETPAAAETPAPKPEIQQWALDRIAQEAARAREERGLREAAERKAQEYEAMLERMRQQPQRDQTQQPQRQEPPRLDSRDAIEVEAARRVYLRDVEDVRSKGLAQYGAEFNDTIRAITAYGVDDAFLQDVIDADRSNAAAVLQQLAHDADRTIAMTRMTPRQRIAELTRLTMQGQKDGALAAAAPKSTTSRAPAPPPPVQPTARQETDWRSDKASEKDYTSGFRETYKKKYGHYPAV